MRCAALCPPLLALGLAACSHAPAPPAAAPALPPWPKPPSPPPVEIVETPAPAPAVESGVPFPPLMAQITEPACVWSTRRWRARTGPTELRLRPNGPVFARVTGGRAQLQIPVGAPSDGLLDVGSSGLVLTGFVSRAQITLYAAADVAMSGVVYPNAYTPLSYVEGTSAGVTLTMRAPDGVLPVKKPLAATRACEDVSLDTGARLDPAKAAFGIGRGTLETALGNRPIAVYGDPDRPSEVQIALAPGTFVQAYAKKGAFTRIGVYLDHAYVAGWVRSERLKSSDVNGYGHRVGSITTGSSGMGYSSRSALFQRTCPADVPLVAEAEGEQRTVGYVRAHTTMDIVEAKGDFFRIAVKNRDIHPALKAAFLVRASDLRRC